MRQHLRAAGEYLLALGLVSSVLFGTLSVWEPVRVAGMSMSPALEAGDLVVVRKHAQACRGSIALVRAVGHRAVLHRVVSVGQDGSLVTRGDANPIDDRERASPNEVAGVVVRVLPAGTLLRRWRGANQVEYHDGSTEQLETTTETTLPARRSSNRDGSGSS
jgi:signal peptidase I